MVPDPTRGDRSTDQMILPGEELSQLDLSEEWRIELLDPAGWREVLETYARTMKLAVALTDTEGRQIGECHNPQPVWRMAHWEAWAVEDGCPFCLAPPVPCTAVADALRTGGVVITQDHAGLSHAAVPLSLGGRYLGALIAGQVFNRYPEPMPLQRVAKRYEVSQQQLWRQAVRQVPLTQATLQVHANLLRSLGDAHLGRRYAAILQRSLDATNRRYRLMIDGVKEYALFTEDGAGRITSWNSGAERMFGYSEAEIMGHDVSCLFPPEDLRNGSIKQGLRAADRAGWVEAEGWRVRKDGTRFFATGVLALLGEGRNREYGRLIRDVTELRESEEALRQAQKLESIGVLAGGIAHDFNNLLTAITLSLNCAKTALPPDHSAYPMLEVAEESSDRAAELTSQLLAYAGKGKFVVTGFDISALIATMLPVITTSIPKNVQLQLALVPELPWIEADARQFGQIVKSLVVNGAEAIGAEEGTLRISTGVRARPGVAGNPGRDVYMEVKDSGSGMSEETKARIFDPFFTTKFMGRGLGLAAVAGILRAHNGRMTVESVPGEGATFTVFFPAVEPVLLKVAVSPPFTAARSTDTILFVEDELSLRILAKVVLERSGYSVLLAKNGREGVDLFRQNANEVAIVLMDMMMPVMGGKEAFQLIREIRPDVPVIVLTGYTEDIVRQELGAGASAGFIQKPYSVTRLVTAIRAALPARGTGCE